MRGRRGGAKEGREARRVEGKRGPPAEPRPPSGAGRAGIVAIDWGRRKKHTACVKSSDIKIIKFENVTELLKRVPPPAILFAEAGGPYLELCKLHDEYGDVCCVGENSAASGR